MKTSFIDNRRNSEIPPEYFPSRCTIQTLVTTVSPEGNVEESWSDYDGHIGIDCSVSPVSGDENLSSTLVYEDSTHNISLLGLYMSITPKMRAVIDSTNYDISMVNNSGYGTNTVLECKVVDV